MLHGGNKMSIYGGLNVTSQKAKNHAKMMYEEIRKRKFDYLNVAENTGFSHEQMQLVKNYLFNANHWIQGKHKRFEPSYEIAESWRRLSVKNGKEIYEHDILLLWHELTEIDILLHNNNFSQEKAHYTATAAYDYQTASDNFYRNRGQL